jgi:hypothetical protein
MIIKVREAAETSSDTGGLPARLAADADFDNVGAFRFWFVGQHWEWSDEVARMHGYEPGTVVLTTELLLSHKHPDDRRAMFRTSSTGHSFQELVFQPPPLYRHRRQSARRDRSGRSDV